MCARRARACNVTDICNISSTEFSLCKKFKKFVFVIVLSIRVCVILP